MESQKRASGVIFAIFRAPSAFKGQDSVIGLLYIINHSIKPTF